MTYVTPVVEHWLEWNGLFNGSIMNDPSTNYTISEHSTMELHIWPVGTTLEEGTLPDHGELNNGGGGGGDQNNPPVPTALHITS